MTRITKSRLEQKVSTLNMVLGRPQQQFSSQPGEPIKFSVGHFVLDNNSQGYTLDEQMSESGGVRVWDAAYAGCTKGHRFTSFC